ncbi:MAG: rhomboid family intramembrane serine protease [Gammaproteobacteria bacterium]|nr:rhomboid family intramembrane serine protease [Gammaproteobacteria bacterium]
MSDSHPQRRAPGAPTSGWICVYRSPWRNQVSEAAFVLTAVGIDNMIDQGEGFQWQLWVPVDDATNASRQLSLYAQDRAEANRPQPQPAEVDKGWWGVAGYLLVIWLIPVLEGYGMLAESTLRAGSMNAGAVAAGEWWRTVTALTLHGDFGHILGNSVFGVIIGLMVGRNFGSGIGWLLVLASGTLGNAANAWIQGDAFTSVGASTATFGALGMVGAYLWQRGGHRAFGLRRSLAPLFAAFALLAFTGVGGENTDVMGHFTGFGAGVLIGLVAAAFNPEDLGLRRQRWCGAVALALIAGSWWLVTRSL